MTKIKQVISYYKCPGNLEEQRQHEPVEWSDTWTCVRDDRCPLCDTELSPFDSEQIRSEDNDR